MVGLTEDDDKWRRWQVCSPEAARAVAEFKEGTVLRVVIILSSITMKTSKVFNKSLQKM